MKSPLEMLKAKAAAPPAPAEPEMESPESARTERLLPAATKLMDAIKTGDASAVAEALSSAYDTCGHSGADAEDDEA